MRVRKGQFGMETLNVADATNDAKHFKTPNVRCSRIRRTNFLCIVSHCLLLGLIAFSYSPTLNEPGHLVAGLSNWEFGRFEVYRVNPPLVRMVAALPVVAAGYEEDWSGFYEGPGARPEFKMGEDLVTANGERSFFLLTIARWACIPFSLLGAIVCYLWARDLYGRTAGLFACAIWCFEPTILGNASLITPDAHATALGLTACYTFWRWLRRPTWTQAALTGVVLGLAELAKTTLIVFYPLWPLMWIVYRWQDRRQMAGRDWIREGGMLGLRMLIGLYVLNLGYGFEGSFTRLKYFQFVSDTFTGQQRNARAPAPPAPDDPPSGDNQKQAVEPAENLNNRFAGTWLGELPAPVPKNYVVGIDLQRKDFEKYSRKSYLRGEREDRGWWYYYLYATAIKVPLGLWGLGAFVLVTRLAGRFRKTSPTTRTDETKALPSARDEAILLFPGIFIFSFVSSQTGFSEHMRYVLPAFPFFFVWIGQAANKLCWNRAADQEAEPAHGRSTQNRPFSRFVVAGLFAWFVASSLWIYPHSLSYFNELVGGPLNGPKHLLGSSVDWCQDLRFLKWWTEKHPEVKELHLAYHSLHDPVVANFDPVNVLPIEAPATETLNQNGPATPGVPAKEGEATTTSTLPPGWYAISINVLHGDWSGRSVGGRSQMDKATREALLRMRPYDRSGYSIMIYRIE
jgi:4-amino-4-deoxy-L-arabinose transferase-like glycosyltransferase